MLDRYLKVKTWLNNNAPKKYAPAKLRVPRRVTVVYIPLENTYGIAESLICI